MVKLELIQALAQTSVQEKESIISVRYGWTNLSLGSLFWHHEAEPRDAKTATLGTDLSIRTSHSCQILIIQTDSNHNLYQLSEIKV